MDNIFGTVLGKVLGLLGLVAVVVLVGMGIQHSKNTSGVAGINLMVSNIQALNATNPFTNLSNAVVVAGDRGNRLAPDNMVNGTTLINAWGGTVTVAPVATNPMQFSVISDGMSSSGCSLLASGASPLTISINGTAMAMPVDPNLAKVACNAGGDANVVSMTYGH